MKEFAACSNDTNIRYFSILENKSVFNIHGAHSDHIKKVSIVNENLILSGSADKIIKLWDIRNHSKPVSFSKMSHPIEDFVTFEENRIAVANGNVISVLSMSSEQILKKENSFTAF